MADINHHKINETFWKYTDTGKIKKALEFYNQNMQEIDVNYKPLNEFSTPLMRAAFRGSLEMVDLLMSNGADLMLVDGAGNTAIHWALKGKHYDIAEQMIIKISDNPDFLADLINKKNYSGDSIISILFWDQEGGDQQINLLNLLKTCGGDFNVKSSFGIPLLYIASASNTSEVMFQWLIDNLKEQNTDVLNSTIYSESISFHFDNMTNGDMNIYGFTPLHFAILSQKLDKIKLLIKNGTDVDKNRPKDILEMYEKRIKSKESGVKEFLLDIELERIFEALGDAVERIPEIQGFYEEDKTVYVDISKGKKEYVEQQLMEMCPDLRKHIQVSLIEQPSEPEYMSKTWLGVTSIGENLIDNVDGTIKCFSDLPSISYGSIAGFMKDTKGQQYAVTANHVVAKQLDEIYGDNRHIFTEHDSGLLKISDKFFGAFGNINTNGVDAAIMPLYKEISKPFPHETTSVAIFVGDRSGLLHQKVRMKGATTPYNTGEVCIINYRSKIAGKVAVTVKVKPTGKVLHFAAKGDSGALVSLDDAQGSALGLVTMTQTDFMHKDVKLEQSATIVLLYDCLKAICQTHKIQLEMGYIIGLNC